MKIKISRLDRVFSNYIRTRDKWTCRRCRKCYHPPTSSLQCAHIMGRRSKGTRWHPDNAVALCSGCHIYFTGHPLMFYDWLAAEIGQDKLDWLRTISKRPTKFTDFDLQVLEKDLKFRLSMLN